MAEPLEMADAADDPARGRLRARLHRSDRRPTALPLGLRSDPQAAGGDEDAMTSVPVIVDRSAAVMSDFVCGANEDGVHLTGVNWERDVELADASVRDLRNVVAGDPDPTGADGTLDIVRGIEVGHIFQLGDTYSEPLGATVLDEGGRPRNLLMGCYGIGITRIAGRRHRAAERRQGASSGPTRSPRSRRSCRRSTWPSPRPVAEAAEALYEELLAAGVDVLFDDRPLRPGVMFADMELLGIPHRFVVSDKLLADGALEYKGRGDAEARVVGRDEALATLGR